MIRLHQVTKKFGHFTAVDNVSLEVGEGEFYGILGPNGAGKTTTIKMMTGLYSPSSGTVEIDGSDIERFPTKSKLVIGYIPDQPFLYEKLSGREFLYFSGGLYKMNHHEITKRINELVERFEIGPWIDQRSENFSQGMRQRTVIVAALLHRPKVLIIDEPMVGLDPRSAHIVKEVLKEQVHGGAAIFMSTHSLPVVEELCTRIGVIKEGKLVFEDSLGGFQVFKDKYNGTFESAFLELTK